MFISPVSNLSFNSNKRTVYKNGKVLYKNKTNFFREDLNWKNLALFLSEKYQNVDKVNVFNFACSDGSEPYSLAVVLMEYLGLDALKFFPIQASDIDEEIIAKAKCGPCNITVRDLYQINQMTKDDYGKYFQAHPPENKNYYMAVTPKPPINRAIEFSQGNILDGLDELPEHNNVVFARNFWCYLDEENRNKMIRKFIDILDKTSSLIIGELEYGHNYDELLERHGFRSFGPTGVFSKVR